MAGLMTSILFVNIVILILVEVVQGIGFNYDGSGDLQKTHDAIVACGNIVDGVIVSPSTASKYDYWEAIALNVRIPNEDVPKVALSAQSFEVWFNGTISPLVSYPYITIFYIIVGKEMIPGPFAKEVVSLINVLQRELYKRGFNEIQVTTSVGSSVLGVSHPPSAGDFAANAVREMKDLLQFLSANGAPLMLNVYPYYVYAADPANTPLDYALGNATAPVIHDRELSYMNLFDAMVDSYFWAMEKAGYPNVNIWVSETGWPRAGNGNFTTPELAATYNKNFFEHIKKCGTPKRLKVYLRSYIYSFYDGPNDYFGVFDSTNSTLLYPFPCVKQ